MWCIRCMYVFNYVLYVCNCVYVRRYVGIHIMCNAVYVLFCICTPHAHIHRPVGGGFLPLCVPLQILEVPSKLFYSNSLVAKASFPLTGPQDIPPVGFVGVDGQEKKDEDSPSFQNLLEAEKVAAKVNMRLVMCELTRT